MSKNDPHSKYLSSFYSTPAGRNPPKNVHNSSKEPPKVSPDADKFKNPADFFRSSQSISSQTSSQIKKIPTVKRTSFGSGGSTHTMLSQTFHQKKPVIATMNTTASRQFTTGMKKNLPTNQRHYFGVDETLASTKALELQWTTKMRLAKKAELEALVTSGGDKHNLKKSELGKSPSGKMSWADSSFTETDRACKNQQNDPWYSNDVWGDDLPVEAIDECLRVASSQEPNKPTTSRKPTDPLYSWIDEPWASPEKREPTHFQTQKPKPAAPSARTLFRSPNVNDVKMSDDFSSLLAEDDNSFITCLENLESQNIPGPSSSNFVQGSSLNTQKPLPPHSSKLQTVDLFKLEDKHVPFSDRMPVSSTTGSKSSFIVKAKEYESPRKYEGLTQSQRKLQKPTKSLPSPATSKQGFTTEWLRGQLEKINSDYSTLKEDVQLKEGESKLLREKLKTAEEEVKKHKLEKVKEIETLRETFEKKVKQLEKQLEATQTQALFKMKEAESSLKNYRDSKVTFRTPERPTELSFKGLQVTGTRPGESTKVLCDQTAFSDVINETAYASPLKTSVLFVEATPEKPLFEDSQEAVAPSCVPHVDGELRKHHINIKHVFNCSFLRKNEAFSRAVDKVVNETQPPKKELNHFLMPPMEYLPHTLLQTEFSEQEFENYPIRRPTLIELWGASYDAFGEVTLNDYENTKVGDTLPTDTAKNILSKSRHFSSLEPLYKNLIALSHKSDGSPLHRSMANEIVEMAIKMVRELYATLGDPRLLQTSYTIYDRDPKILNEFQDCSELVDQFDCLSPENWKNESFVELRRCLIFVGFLSSVDHLTARQIINPKAHNAGRSSDYFSPNIDTHSAPRNTDVALKVIVHEGQRKPSELKLMHMYRDLHSKKLTLVSELVTNLVQNFDTLSHTPSHEDKSTLLKVEAMDTDSHTADAALQVALQSVEDITEYRVLPDSQDHSQSTPTYEEYLASLNKLNLELDEGDVRDTVAEIEGILNPQKVMMMMNLKSTQPYVEQESGSVKLFKDWEHVASTFLNTIKSDILKVDLGNSNEVICAPITRCITPLEQQLLEITFQNTKELRSRLRKCVESKVSSDLDLTQYVPDNLEDDTDLSRKRKISHDEEPRKVTRGESYHTPPFDKSLYSQIRKDKDEVVVMETQTQLLSQVEDDQLTKFEKREEMAELEKNMLAKEMDVDSKYIPSSTKHALAPFKVAGGTTTACEDSAGREVVMEIEKMFLSQVKPDALEESTWSSESDDEALERIKSNEDIEIEFIPDLLKNFRHKLNNAGLLELLCEVFKEGGVLRFTHRLNGVMLGTLMMLQNIVAHQKAEVGPFCSKIVTIIREILYTRPSPRILLEVNVLLRYCVTIPGFSRMLCHNASSETFVIKPDQVYFTRDACLLEVVCILVTYATDEDSDCKLYFEMAHWVFYIICIERKHISSLYDQHNKSRRRCMCIAAMNNTMVMIYHRALTLYRGQLVSLPKVSHNKKILEGIVLHGIQVLRFIHSYGYPSFLFSIKNQYHEYCQLLHWIKEMHESTGFFADFALSKIDLLVLNKLLKDLKNHNVVPEKPLKPSTASDIKTFFGSGKSWPYDLSNLKSLLTSDSSESDDD